jgi:hypothetical protein
MDRWLTGTSHWRCLFFKNGKSADLDGETVGAVDPGSVERHSRLPGPERDASPMAAGLLTQPVEAGCMPCSAAMPTNSPKTAASGWCAKGICLNASREFSKRAIKVLLFGGLQSIEARSG